MEPLIVQMQIGVDCTKRAKVCRWESHCCQSNSVNKSTGGPTNILWHSYGNQVENKEALIKHWLATSCVLSLFVCVCVSV